MKLIILNNDNTSEVINTMDQLREKRNELLSQCDYIMMPDYSCSPTRKALYGIYRQALRDLPSKTNDLNNITWPVAP